MTQENGTTRCPHCDATQTQTWGRRSWALTGLALLVGGLLLFWVVLPFPLGPVAIVGGLILLLASPFLPEIRRCQECRTRLPSSDRAQRR